MLETIRTILYPTQNSIRRSGMQIAMRFAGEIVFVLYMALFISDTINIDVLYASLKGNVIFVDDPSISDSLFDTGSQHHQSDFDAPVHSNFHEKFTAKESGRLGSDNVVKNVITEDEDSPGIADAILSSSFTENGELPRPESEVRAEDAIPCLDRTISYQRILI